MIGLETTYCQKDRLDGVHGLDWPAVCSQYQDDVNRVVADCWARATDDNDWLGWLLLPEETKTLNAIKAYAQSKRNKVEHLIIVGIGGSSLGTLALFESLLPAYWNERHEFYRQGYPKVYFVDNVDPTKLTDLLNVVDLNKTLVNVITKSGSTAETMAGFLWLKGLMEDLFGKTKLPEHFVLTTDPSKGLLRKIADEEGFTAFEVPPSVGGRFSVFSAVGMLPAALLGLDVDALIAGAKDLIPKFKSKDLSENLAARGALAQFALNRQGHSISVFMPYSARMAYTADWYVQLWAESLGKRHNLKGEEVFEGSTPVRAIGVTDQHSQVQLFNEGPHDKVITFVRVQSLPDDITIPNLYPDESGLAYLGGATFSTLLNAEADATQASLTRNGRPNMIYNLPKLDAYHLAQLLFTLEMQTAIAGGLMGIDPFDQPGVELGKQYTYALMGRPGYEELKADMAQLQMA